MRKLWHDDAWEEYLYWQTQDKKKHIIKSYKSPWDASPAGFYLLKQIRELHNYCITEK